MVKQNQDTPNRQLAPFGEALYVARQITTRRPREEQPEEYGKLEKAMGQLDDRGRVTIVHRLVGELLEDKAPIQGLFAAATIAKKKGIAYNAAAVRRAQLKGDLQTSDLQTAGIASLPEEIKDFRNLHFRYDVRPETLKKASPILREAGKIEAANIIDEHLREQNRRQIINQYRREKEAKAKTPGTEETPTEAVAVKEKAAGAEKPTNAKKPAKKTTKSNTAKS